jgi:hypothetical protein
MTFQVKFPDGNAQVIDMAGTIVTAKDLRLVLDKQLGKPGSVHAIFEDEKRDSLMVDDQPLVSDVVYYVQVFESQDALEEALDIENSPM